MDTMNKKHTQLIQALETLEKSLNAFKKIEQKSETSSQTYDYEEYRIHRDSVIQRFEYSIDLFWKYIKKYVESVHLVVGINVPAEVVRTACSARIINEEESENILEMIKGRNMTSHIYIEEIAEKLVGQIPKYYSVMQQVARRLKL